MKNKKVKIIMIISSLAIILLGIMISYSYFTAIVNNKNQELTGETGTLALTFEDGNPGINEKLEFGNSVEKTFTIENTGSLEAIVKMNFINFINTYKEGSLTYTLSYSEEENGVYTEIIKDKYAPISKKESTRELANNLSIPVGAKYFYKLVLKLNYLNDVDQTGDLDAIFSTNFRLEEKGFGYTLYFDTSGGELEFDSKDYDLNMKIGELPKPTKTGYYFLGWFTERDNGEKIDAEALLTENKTVYAHWEKLRAATQLLDKSNDATITDYNSGVKEELYAFKQEATAQTEALTDYRYIGSIPNNYIQFNDEVWRIIGVFPVEGENGEKVERVKIIREESIGNISWDTSKRSVWPTSSLYNLLNLGEYYNREGNYESIGLNERAKNQIAPAKFYLGGSSSSRNLSGAVYYGFERSTVSQQGYTNSICNVAIMYPSDYVYTYAYNIDNQCYENAYKCSAGNPQSGWLFNSTNEWTITHKSNTYLQVFNITSSGVVTNTTGSSSGTTGLRFVRPVVYLRPDVEIINGDGSEGNPYILGL